MRAAREWEPGSTGHRRIDSLEDAGVDDRHDDAEDDAGDQRFGVEAENLQLVTAERLLLAHHPLECAGLYGHVIHPFPLKNYVAPRRLAALTSSPGITSSAQRARPHRGPARRWCRAAGRGRLPGA